MDTQLGQIAPAALTREVDQPALPREAI